MKTIENKTFNEISIGDSASLTRTLTLRDVEMFAALSNNYNPTHLDQAWASRLLKTEKISGPGTWANSLFSSLFGNHLPGPGTVLKTLNLSYHRQIELGDSLTLRILCVEKDQAANKVVFECSAMNQREELVISGKAELLAPTEKITIETKRLPEVQLRHRHQVFESLIENADCGTPVTVSVCHPVDEVSLKGAVEAARRGIIIPTLVGPAEKIKETADTFGLDISHYDLIDTSHSHASVEKAVALCRSGTCEALMKGSLHTDELMREVASRDRGLRTGRRISHVFIMDVPTYPKPLFITDAAINIYPTLEDKVDILQNCIDLVHVMGNKTPLVAILSAVETVYPKITSTIEAAALCKMADRGQITGAILDGPLAFDNAISKEAAKIKGITSQVAGDADILLVPDLEAGNMLAKQLSYLAEADAAGIVLGTRVPVILTSRADSPKSRLVSCAVAAQYAKAQRTLQH